jgi:hypothetical protein
MEKELIPYEQALDLKELGFDEECLAFYNSTFQTPNELLYPQYGGEVGNWNVENHLISAPLYQQAFSWFRKNRLRFCITARKFEKDYLYKVNILNFTEYNDDYEYLTYEEAELACLMKLIQIIKNK